MTDDAWDQEDEHRRADFEHMLARMQQDHEDLTIEEAEDSLSRMGYVGECPMPDQAHPALARHAAFVRGRTDWTLRLPVIRSHPATYMSADEAYVVDASPATVTLTRRKCAAPAPFTGSGMAVYTWPVWTDNYGRHISGPAEMAWQRA
jgi:hypothetical protein